MSQWLFEQIGNDPNPVIALQSSLNWIQSLSAEISSFHGITPLDQYNSALAQIRGNRAALLQNPERLDLYTANSHLRFPIIFTPYNTPRFAPEPLEYT